MNNPQAIFVLPIATVNINVTEFKSLSNEIFSVIPPLHPECGMYMPLDGYAVTNIKIGQGNIVNL